MRQLSVLFVFVFSLLINGCNSSSDKNDSPFKKGKEVKGSVVTVIDGDTYDLLVNGNQTIRIRMEGIDAPERGMPFYKKAKKYLGSLCIDQEIKIKITGKDKYDRILAYSYLNDGRELSEEMIKAGLAWHYKKYNSNKTLSKLEQEAKDNRIGLWIHDDPMAPWTNRSLHKKGISTKSYFDIKENEQ